MGTNNRLVLPLLLGVILPAGWAAEDKKTDGREIAGPQADTAPVVSLVEDSLAREGQAAVARALKWLETKQQPGGTWSSSAFPAITALAVCGFLRRPGSSPAKERENPGVKKALAYIVGCAQPDGGIYLPAKNPGEGGLMNYNTALCLMALLESRDPAYEPVMRKARASLAAWQYLEDGPCYGGMGYDPEEKKGKPSQADLSNTMMALEALRRTEYLEAGEQARHLQEERKKVGESGNGFHWEAAIKFLSRCQHLSEANDQKWVSKKDEERGGFVYSPVESKAGEILEERKGEGDGSASSLRSYGSMSYAGLLSFIYAHVDRTDARVKAVVDWLGKHFTVEENPPLGKQGLFYYYHTMAKALHIYGEKKLSTPQGTVEWRGALLTKLVKLQKINDIGHGYWINDNNRWWEGDSELVTAYAVLTLETLIGQ